MVCMRRLINHRNYGRRVVLYVDIDAAFYKGPLINKQGKRTVGYAEQKP
jgi:hypothetical protein